MKTGTSTPSTLTLKALEEGKQAMATNIYYDNFTYKGIRYWSKEEMNVVKKRDKQNRKYKNKLNKLL